MKIIDLLNKIANGEEVPKKVLYNEIEYSYVERNRMFAKYIREPFNAKLPYYLFTDIINIDDEVEIIEEEKKIPEKIEYYDDSIAWVIDDVGQLRDVDKFIIDKLNEVLDYLKSKGDE